MNTTKEMNIFGKEQIRKLDGDFDTSRPVFGIDLGTTNSAISVITKGDRPKTIKLSNGKYTMPSCVMWKDGKFIVGAEAYKHRECANVIYSVKRHMQRANKKVTFTDGSKTLTMTPAEVSAEILKGLVEQAGSLYGEIKDVIVTVPAYFNQIGRNATREACELAGLNLLDILNEPTAAALCYDIADGDITEFVTFDFGGGTFDATLARICNSNQGEDDILDIYGLSSHEEKTESCKTVECIAIAGDSHLGGDDIDREMYQILCKKLRQRGIDTSLFSREFEESLILRLEGFKKQDSEAMYQIHVVTDLISGGVHVDEEVTITANDFEEAMMPSYLKCKKILDKLLMENHSNAKKIILVGGSTKNPHLIRRMHMDYPDFEISNALDQDLAVTLGAAIKGKITKFGSDTVQIFDILPMTIGVLDEDNVLPILTAGSVLPVTESHCFTTTENNQKIMKVKVLQGNSSNPDDCTFLGELTFKDIPPAPEGVPVLSVSLSVSATSQMKCIGKVNGVSQELKLDLTGESAEREKMTKEEKLLKRWRRIANNMQSSMDKRQLITLIEGYPDLVSKHDIMSFIREHSEGMNHESKS